MPETTRSMSRSSQLSSEGFTTKSPSSLPIRTAPTCFGSGMSDTAIAAEAPFIARMSYGCSCSADMVWQTSWVS